MSRRSLPILTALALACCTLPLRAHIAPGTEPQTTTLASASLPDSPGATWSVASAATDSSASGSFSSAVAEYSETPADKTSSLHQQANPPANVASPTSMFISPTQSAPALSATGKVRLGIRSAVTPFAAVGWITAAAYSQAVDSSPNYGQGWKPFAQRLGAAAARGSSEGIFSASVFAPIYHEDPRYYMLGRGHSVLKRGVYAATRTVITRSDNGSATPNLSLLSGNAAGAILTNAYYPDANRSATGTAKTFAGSIGGSALGFVLREFLADALGVVHLNILQ